MKIAMLDPSLFTPRYDDALCAALARSGAKVTLFGRPLRPTDILTPASYSYRDSYFRIGEAIRARFGDRVPVRAFKAVEYAARSVINPFDPTAFDVVHSQWLPVAPVDARILRSIASKVPTAHTVHNVEAYHGIGDAAVQGRGYGAMLGRFDALIVHGQTSRAALIERGIDAAGIHIVPHPPIRLARAEDRTPDTRSGRKRVLLFGTLKAYKGIDLMVAACLKQWSAGQNFELAFAGNAFVDFTPLIETIRSAGFGDRLVVDLGFLTEQRLDAHIRAADILAFPYRAIEASGALMAALHYGKAIVASDVPSFWELNSRSAGQALALFRSGDADALARTLGDLIDNATMRRLLGEAAVRLDGALPDWDDAAALTLDAYRDAITRWRARCAVDKAHS